MKRITVKKLGIIFFSMLCVTAFSQPSIQTNEVKFQYLGSEAKSPVSFFVTRHTVTAGQLFETKDNAFLPVAQSPENTTLQIHSGRQKSRQVFEDITRWGFDASDAPNELNFAVEGTLALSPISGKTFLCKNIVLGQTNVGLDTRWYLFSHDGGGRTPDGYRYTNLTCHTPDGLTGKFQVLKDAGSEGNIFHIRQNNASPYAKSQDGSEDDNKCSVLSILIVNTTPDTCKLVYQNLSHGYVISNSHIPAFIPSNTSAPALELLQGWWSGPAITLTYQCGENRQITLYTKQNYCFLEAGNITARTTNTQNMQADSIARMGSWFWGQHGTLSWALM